MSGTKEDLADARLNQNQEFSLRLPRLFCGRTGMCRSRHCVGILELLMTHHQGLKDARVKLRKDRWGFLYNSLDFHNTSVHYPRDFHLSGFSTRVKDRDDLDLIRRNLIKNRERKTADDTASQTTVNIRILMGIGDDSCERIIDTVHEFKI
jgi:hypothetical protein